MTRRFWISFCDNDRPKGDQFLGVCIVDVTDYEAAQMVPQIDRDYPQHKPGAEWIAAATAKAWRYGCNPGGSAASLDITDHPHPDGVEVPLNTLMDRAELKRRGLGE